MFTSVNRPQRAEYELVGTTDASSDDGGLSKELEAVVAEISHDPENFPNSIRDEDIPIQERRPWTGWIQGAARALVPSFCMPSTKEQKEQPPRPLSSTAWLGKLHPPHDT